MARSIIIPLIALILSCGVLINGCAQPQPASQ